MNEPTVLIQFDRKDLVPVAFFFNGETDVETRKLREIMSEKFPDSQSKEG